MSLENEILLRPRFKLEINKDNEEALQTFEELPKEEKEFLVSRVDNHVFIRIPKNKQHFWSPQLHLEIDNLGDNKSELRGLFGPKSSVWTLFMFLHFVVAVLFIGFGSWAYSNWSLDNPYGLQIGLMALMIIAWFALYFSGRMGKSKGKNEMKQLCSFLENTLDLKEVKEKEDCV